MLLSIGTLRHLEEYRSSCSVITRFFRGAVVPSLVIAVNSHEFGDDGLHTIAFPYILDPRFTKAVPLDIENDWSKVEPPLLVNEIAAAVTRTVQKLGMYNLIDLKFPERFGKERWMDELTLGAVDSVINWFRARPSEEENLTKPKPNKPLLIERDPMWGIF